MYKIIKAKILNLHILQLWLMLSAMLVVSPVWADDQYSQNKNRSKFSHNQILQFDIAENGSRFAFDQEPVDEDGMPAYGGEFITEGYLYPHGFLDNQEGVNSDGSPAFPDEVLGRWTCRGWHIGQGAKTETGPWVITNQYFDLGKKYGQHSITTEGYELVDLNESITRAITGGTGKYSRTRGDSTQKLLGFNESLGVNVRVRLRPHK
ncbi:hypothetical protein [Paraglaciecola sp.]|uniref:hypothetical protein n=1 Tax=Paraglaciecola sp. TaxID=1920173 RepID=UPI003EF6C87E